MKPLLRRPAPANQPGRLAPGVVSRFLYTFVFDLLVRLRPASGSKVQEGPHRLHRTDMPWILLRLGWHEQHFGGPAQPNDPVRAHVEHGEDRHLLSLVILAMIVPFEAIAGGRKQL